MKARILIRPKQGILDPQGKAIERALPALGFQGVSERSGRDASSSSRPATPDGLADLCEKLLANPLIEDYEIELSDGAGRLGLKFGVLQFPGSCDDRDALLACSRVGDARLVWHTTPTSRTST